MSQNPHAGFVANFDWATEGSAAPTKYEQEEAWTGLRPLVQLAALAMEQQLRANSFKGGWGSDSAQALYERLESKLTTVEQLAFGEDTDGDTAREAIADAMNYLAMIADTLGAFGNRTTGGQ